MIEAVRVEKSYGDVAAVRGVTLNVSSRSAFGLVGPNGAGKSSLIRMLCGIGAPDAGRVRLAGSDPFRDAHGAKRSLGCVPEYLPLFELLTGAEQLAWVGRIHGVSEQLLADRVRELGSALELSEALPRRINTYSRGMRQKLAFAAALVGDPRILILDEPFEGVDVLSVRAMKAIIRQFVDAGAAMLLSSHMFPLVEDVCDRFGIMADGRLLFEGDSQQLHAESQRVTASGQGSGRPLESVFLNLVAPDFSPMRLETVAHEKEEPL